jgi:hypothetical protein
MPRPTSCSMAACEGEVIIPAEGHGRRGARRDAQLAAAVFTFTVVSPPPTTRLEHEMTAGSGAAQRPTRPTPDGMKAWRRRERDGVARRTDACARERRGGDNWTNRLRNSQVECSREWRKAANTHGPAARRCSLGWRLGRRRAAETRVRRDGSGTLAAAVWPRSHVQDSHGPSSTCWVFL